MPDWNGYIKGGINTAYSLATGNVVGAAYNGIGATMSLFGGGSSNSAKAAAAAAKLQYEYNLALQKQSQQWNEYMYKNRYQMQRKDLENAGINPLFGMGQAPSVTSGTNSVGMADMVGEQNNKFNQMMSLLDFGQNLSAKRAQTKLVEQQVKTEEQNTLLRTAQVLGQQIQNKWLPKEKAAQIKAQYAETMDKLASVNERKASIKLMETNRKATARELQIQQEWDEEHKIAKGWATALRRFGFGGSLGVSLPLKK